MLASAGLEVIQFKHNILLVIIIITITITMDIIKITSMITIMVIVERASSSSLNSAQCSLIEVKSNLIWPQQASRPLEGWSG